MAALPPASHLSFREKEKGGKKGSLSAFYSNFYLGTGSHVHPLAAREAGKCRFPSPPPLGILLTWTNCSSVSQSRE